MRFVITGCGRSGTGYAARLLTAAGASCGHEQAFRPETSRIDFADKVGDASWLAVPWLRAIGMEGIAVFHQLRNPLDVLRSFLGIGFFARPRSACETDPYLRAVWRQDKAVFSFDDDVRRAMSYWIRWNLAVEPHARFSYQVEDLAEDPGILASLLGYANCAARAPLEELLAKADATYNHRERDESLTWDALPDSALTDQMVRMARLYGYDPTL